MITLKNWFYSLNISQDIGLSSNNESWYLEAFSLNQSEVGIFLYSLQAFWDYKVHSYSHVKSIFQNVSTYFFLLQVCTKTLRAEAASTEIKTSFLPQTKNSW